MESGTIADWETFFAAQLGAAATLAGLIFVGLSINLGKIIAAAALPNRALIAIAILIAVLMISSYGLIPGQTLTSLGSETLATGAGLALFTGATELHTLRRVPLRDQRMFVGNMVFLALAVLPYLVGGALMLGGHPDGLYWVGAAIIISFVKAIADAWVLLVEINR